MFNKSMVADLVNVPVTFDRLYRDESGRPIIFHFTFRMETDGDTEQIQRKSAMGLSQREVSLERFCLLITKAPPEIDDFPSDQPIAEAARAYFGGEKMYHMVKGAMTNYNSAVNPAELFRSI